MLPPYLYEILKRQKCYALPSCEFINLTSLVIERFYAENA